MNHIDAIGHNGGEALHYEWIIRGVRYKLNQNGIYALYFKDNYTWTESASVTNQSLMEGMDETTN